jgi:hypothetical protein
MKYKFKKIDFSYGTMPKDKITYDFGVDYESLDEKHKVLFEIFLKQNQNINHYEFTIFSKS